MPLTVESHINSAEIASEIYKIGAEVVHKCLSCNRGEHSGDKNLMEVTDAGIEICQKKKSGKILHKRSLRLTCKKCERPTCKYLGNDEFLPQGHTDSLLTILYSKEPPKPSEEPSPEFRERVAKKAKRKAHDDNIKGAPLPKKK